MKRYIMGIALATALQGCAGPDIAAQVQAELRRQRAIELRSDVDDYRDRLEVVESRYERLGIRSATGVQGLDMLERKIDSLYLRAIEQDARTFQLALEATGHETEERRNAVREEANLRRESTMRVLDYIQVTHSILNARIDARAMHEEIETRREQLIRGYESRIMDSTEAQKRDLVDEYSSEEQALEQSYQPRIRELDSRIEELQRSFEQALERINSIGRRPRRVS